MANINLLPWREWERERKKNEFLTNVVAVLLFGGILVFAAGWHLDGEKERQDERNKFLQDRIVELDTRIAKIADLNRKREDLLARMRVIQELQGNRPVIVRVFDELVRTMAKGAYYSSVEKKGGTLSMAGTAESNNRISTLMRQLEASEWFAEPNLKGIKENSAAGPQASNFQLTVSQTNPQQDNGERG